MAQLYLAEFWERPQPIHISLVRSGLNGIIRIRIRIPWDQTMEKKISDAFLPKNRPHPQVAACGWKSVKRYRAKQSKGISKFESLQVGVKPTWRLCLMSWATSLFSGSFSRPMTKWTRPEVFLNTEAAYACVTPTRLAESTWVSKDG